MNAATTPESNLDALRAQVKAAESAAPKAGLAHPLLGKPVSVRTVTMIYTGRMMAYDEFGIQLLEAAWIPCTERWADYAKNGAVAQCEPYPADIPVFINPAAVLDIFQFNDNLPKQQR